MAWAFLRANGHLTPSILARCYGGRGGEAEKGFVNPRCCGVFSSVNAASHCHSHSTVMRRATVSSSACHSYDENCLIVYVCLIWKICGVSCDHCRRNQNPYQGLQKVKD
jgi:hypothetical protein